MSGRRKRLCGDSVRASDLVLMDVNPPDIDGLELTLRLKAARTCGGIPVIALTANAMYGDRERCLAAGCDGYIPKLITKSLLISTVGDVLRTSSPRALQVDSVRGPTN
ncbi:MAG: response regulator [Chloroflexi bacterium]|nr:response regulator [Chloroflexota bacterium]